MAEDGLKARSEESILFQNGDCSVILLDVPRSIEEAQVLSCTQGSRDRRLKRLISSKPPGKPFETPEPKDGTKFLSSTGTVADLMAAVSVNNALNVLNESYSGPWCLPRVLAEPGGKTDESRTGRKRKAASNQEGDVAEKDNRISKPLIPEGSVYLQGTISSERARFLSEAPMFDLIVLDPPWPNRSARRKKGNYKTAESLDEIRETLSLIPIATHLAPKGLVAVWITNKASVLKLLTGPRGLFSEWGLELIDEWTWLKVTTAGESIVDVNSSWRKPWERILIAAKRGSERRKSTGQVRVIVSVPDLHSRKPNLRALFERMLPPGYKGLEVFARNLTTGWWSWGDEVLKFQQPEHWIEG